MHGRHFTLEEREFLAIQLALGEAGAKVAEELGCHPGTIRRELKRNQVAGTYLPAQAQALADERRRASKVPWKLEEPELAQVRQQYDSEEYLRACFAWNRGSEVPEAGLGAVSVQRPR